MKYNSNIKEIKELTIVKSAIYNLVLAIFISLALGVFCVYAFGLKLDVVLSDSMSPTFYKDDIVIVRKVNEYKVDDIIEFQFSGTSEPVTHRIKEVKKADGKIFYITKGDAVNKKTETVAHDKVNGKVISVIENGNNIYQFVKSNYFLFIDIILGVWVLSSTISAEIEMRKHNIAKAE